MSLKGQSAETITDIDGNVYKCVKIGSQLWMQENLKVAHYRNGNSIPTGLVDTTWAKTRTGAYAIYNNDTIQHRIFGKLYNGFTVNDPRGLCPVGWHVPSDNDWKELELFLGMPLKKFEKFGTRGAKQNIAGKMKATGNLKDGSGLWMNYDKDANNETGFSGLPGGVRMQSGKYSYLGEAGSWWTSTNIIKSPRYSWYRLLDFNRRIYRDAIFMGMGYSVRCLKD